MSKTSPTYVVIGIGLGTDTLGGVTESQRRPVPPGHILYRGRDGQSAMNTITRKWAEARRDERDPASYQLLASADDGATWYEVGVQPHSPASV